MTQNFVQTANGGNSVTFSFGGSGHLAGEIDGGVDYRLERHRQLAGRLRPVRLG